MENKIIQGDALEVLKTLPDESVDCVITSPPYNLDIEYDSWNDSMPWDKYYEWCEKWLMEILRVLKSDGRLCLNHYLSCGTSKQRTAPLMTLNTIAEHLGFKHHGVAIWTDITLTKRTAWGSWLSASAPYVNSPYEGVLILYKNSWKKLNNGESTIDSKTFMKATSGIWNIATDREKLTKANFPQTLPAWCINLLTYKNDIILDPFNGSGTTTWVAKQLGRKFIGIEISPKYCKIARERLRQEILL